MSHLGRGIIPAVFLLVCFSHQVLAAETINFPKDAPRHADYIVEKAEFWKDFFSIYQKHTTDSINIQDRAFEFLCNGKGIVPESPQLTDTFGKPRLMTPTEARAFGKKLYDDGSRDPLVLMELSRVSSELELMQPATWCSNQSLKEFQKSSYPRGINFLLQSQALQARDSSNRNALDRIKEEILLAIPDWMRLCTTLLQGRDGRIIRRIAMEEVENALLQRPSSDFAGYPALLQILSDEAASMDPWMSQMLSGMIEDRLCWYYRYRVRDQPSGELARQHIQQSGRHFRAAIDLRKDIPLSFARMMICAENGGDDRPASYWFQRCIEVELDNVQIYNNMVLYLSPRWGGSVEQMEGFVDQCHKTGRFDTEIPRTYLRFTDSVEASFRGDKERLLNFLNRPGIYDKILEVCDGYIERLSSSNSKLSLQSHFLARKLRIASLLDRHEDCVKFWKQWRPELDDRELALAKLDRRFDESRATACLQFENQIDELAKSARSSDGSQALAQSVAAKYQKMIDAAQTDESQSYLRAMSELSQLEMAYRRGEWVNLAFDPELMQWEGDKSHWTVKSKTEAVGSNIGSLSDFLLTHRGSFPGPKEITLEVGGVKQMTTPFLFGVHLGNRNTHYDALICFMHHEWSSFGISRKGKGISQEIQFTKPRFLRICAWGPQAIEFYVNGVTCSQLAQPRFVIKDKVALGNIDSCQEMGSVTVKNFRMRQLTGEFPTTFETEEEAADFYSKRIAKEPLNHDFYVKRGFSYHNQGKTDKAIEDFFKALELGKNRVYVRFDLGTILCDLGRFEEGFSLYEEALRLAKGKHKPTGKISCLFALRLATKPDATPDDAKKALSIVQQLKKNKFYSRRSEPWVAAACAHLILKQYDQASQAAKKVRRMNGSFRIRASNAILEAVEKETLLDYETIEKTRI